MKTQRKPVKKQVVIKVQRNFPCPCGKKVDKIYTDEDNKQVTIPTPVKYKNCCWIKNALGLTIPNHRYKYSFE